MSKRKKGKFPIWWTDKSSLGILAGFGLTYFVLVPHVGNFFDAHLYHWLFSFVGGILGFGIGLLFDTGLHSVTHLFRGGSKKVTLGQSKGEKERKKAK